MDTSIKKRTARADYKNWIPQGMIWALCAGTSVLLAGTAVLDQFFKGKKGQLLCGACGIGALACGVGLAWTLEAYDSFSYDGERKLSKQVVEGVAKHVVLPEGGIGLDVGCGSGALTIACAKKNPQASMVGIDRWGKEYASYSKNLCWENAAAEGVTNVRFQKGNAVKLDFPDEYFDAVTSNYVYHNISGADKQKLLLETLRVLKKGGTFAIHDIFTTRRYGDMRAFREKLMRIGFEKVELLSTTNGMFMEPTEARRLMLTGSALLVGVK